MQASFAHRSHHHRQHTPPTISTATTTSSKLRSPSTSMSPRSGGFSVSTTTSPSSSSSTTMTTADILKTKANRRKKTELPPVFGYMERGDWPKACETLRRHPREAKTWATIRIKAQNEMTSNSSPSSSSGKPATMETKRLALHHACFKLRGAGALPAPAHLEQDPYVQVCRLILMLITLYPEAAGQRESRHGCLPLHLAAFASCAPRAEAAEPNVESEVTSSTTSTTATTNTNNPLRRPATMTRRAASDATTDTVHTHLSAVHAEERYTGVMSDRAMRRRQDPGISVSLSKHSAIPPHREELLVQVLNALLDAHPRGIRSDSEGGRNALHTACAGRATPRVVATLVQADRSAARQRNKDGFLPLHLAAHWGVSHPAVVVCLLRAYPDATVGRNRWERTPLEEALCMAGENGRPHQGALVRALRKHPDYWTRPVSEVVEAPVSAIRAPVDMDVSLPSNESSYDEHERAPVKQSLLDQVGIEQNSSGNGTEVFSFGSIMQHLTGTLPAAPPAAPRKKNRDPSVPLVDLIRAQDWEGVEERLVAMPLESEEELQVLTQGGFMASTGMTPLHFACERQPPVTVVQTFVEAFPVAVLTRTMPGGCLPVHIACTWHAASSVVQALLQADPGSAQVKDELGNLPLHSACFSGADEAVVQALLTADPNAVLRRNHQGSKPADICKRLRHANRSAILHALRQQETAARHRRGRSSGTWSEVATLAEEANRREGAPGMDRHFVVDDDMVQAAPEEMVDEELVWI